MKKSCPVTCGACATHGGGRRQETRRHHTVTHLCFKLINPDPSHYNLLDTPETRCDDNSSPGDDGKIWFTGFMEYCIAREIKITQASAGRQVASNGWQYSPPHTPAHGAGMNIVIQQESCYPPPEIFKDIQLCPGLEKTYDVYSVHQKKGVAGVAALKASPDFSKLTCPARFVDTAQIPWRVDYKLEYRICTHRSWTKRRTLADALGLTLAYSVYAQAVVGVLIIGIMVKCGCVQKNITALRKQAGSSAQ